MVHQRTDVRTPKWRVIFLCHSHKMQQHHSEKLSASYVPNVLWVISREKKQAKDKKIPQTCCQLLPASSHLPFLDHLFHWISFPHHHLRGLVELFVRRTVYLLVHSSTFIVCKKKCKFKKLYGYSQINSLFKGKKKTKKGVQSGNSRIQENGAYWSWCCFYYESPLVMLHFFCACCDCFI